MGDLYLGFDGDYRDFKEYSWRIRNPNSNCIR